jgi:hypothetical protein
MIYRSLFLEQIEANNMLFIDFAEIKKSRIYSFIGKSLLRERIQGNSLILRIIPFWQT